LLCAGQGCCFVGGDIRLQRRLGCVEKLGDLVVVFLRSGWLEHLVTQALVGRGSAGGNHHHRGCLAWRDLRGIRRSRHDRRRGGSVISHDVLRCFGSKLGVYELVIRIINIIVIHCRNHRGGRRDIFSLLVYFRNFFFFFFFFFVLIDF